MMQDNKIIYENDACRIEYFYSVPELQKEIVCVFSAGGNKNLDGNNFGGSYLSRNNFDIIAFKIINDDWFQSIPKKVLCDIDTLIDSKLYSKRLGTGTSMGAYAAIAFSKLLKFNTVLAYSPQYRIDEEFDMRWKDIASKIQWNYPIAKETISNSCQFFIIYDDKNLDGRQFVKLKDLIPADNLFSKKVSYSSHCAAIFLNEVGRLKEVTLAILRSGKLKEINLKVNRFLSASYLLNISEELIRRKKLITVVNLLDSAIQAHPNNIKLKELYKKTFQQKPLKSFQKGIASNYVRPIRVVIPFYKNPHLVKPLYDSLVRCVDELHKLKCQIYFYNDSPDDLDLIQGIEQSVNLGKLDVQVINNQKNIGFVLTMNQAFENAIDSHHDVIILNSDTEIFPGAFTELARVAYLDPMIGFVSPRSNNATICTLPHDAEMLNESADVHYSRFINVSKNLSDYSYTPTVVGFCLFIKWDILAEFGGFDHLYGGGYNEENDLIMRANKCGYRAVLANKAFVYHIGEASFSQAENNRAVLDKDNRKLLLDRYPYFDQLVRNYFESPEYRAEKLLSPLANPNIVKICFDLSSFGTYHNGTFEAGLATLNAASLVWPKTVEITVCISKEAWEFHDLEKNSRLRRIDIHQPNEIFSAVIRYGQPFSKNCISRVLSRSPVVAFFMLDTIAADCGHLSVNLDENLWRYVMKWSDLIFTNSTFTSEQLIKRYKLGEKSDLLPILHSTDPNDYSNKNLSKQPISNIYGNLKLSSSVLIVGNKFNHKYINETVSALSVALPQINFIVLGDMNNQVTNILRIKTGDLTNSEMDHLYLSVQAVIFPSHYEGFGFPVMHSLSKRKPIYVRRLSPFKEIAKTIKSGYENIHWFGSTHALIEQLRYGIPEWQGQDLLGETSGWVRSANEILEAILSKIEQINHVDLANRIRWFELSFYGGVESHKESIDHSKYQLLLSRNDDIENQLQAFQESTSWKITAPLRIMKDLYLTLSKK